MGKKFRITLLLALIPFLTPCERPNMRTQTVNAKKYDQPSPRGVETNLLDIPIELKVSGEYIKAFLAAYSSFKDDAMIPQEKRDIEHYDVEFRQRDDMFYVLLIAKRKVSEAEVDGGESELGKDVVYSVRKRDFTVVERKFFR